jgi:predicted DNA-binding transcriptional regulator AlpA
MATETDIITATIPEFRRLSGISRSRIYELLDAGELESVHIGARRLVIVDSYRQLIERQRGRQAPTAPVPSRGKSSATPRP